MLSIQQTSKLSMGGNLIVHAMVIIFMSIINIEPAKAQNNNFFGNVLGGMLGAALVQAAQDAWTNLEPNLQYCMIRGLEANRANVNQLIENGIGPQDERLSQLSSICEQINPNSLRQNYSCRIQDEGGNSFESICDQSLGINENGRNTVITYQQAVDYRFSNREILLLDVENEAGLARRQALQESNERKKYLVEIITGSQNIMNSKANKIKNKARQIYDKATSIANNNNYILDEKTYQNLKKQYDDLVTVVDNENKLNDFKNQLSENINIVNEKLQNLRSQNFKQNCIKIVTAAKNISQSTNIEALKQSIEDLRKLDQQIITFNQYSDNLNTIIDKLKKIVPDEYRDAFHDKIEALERDASNQIESANIQKIEQSISQAKQLNTQIEEILLKLKQFRYARENLKDKTKDLRNKILKYSTVEITSALDKIDEELNNLRDDEKNIANISNNNLQKMEQEVSELILRSSVLIKINEFIDAEILSSWQKNKQQIYVYAGEKFKIENDGGISNFAELKYCNLSNKKSTELEGEIKFNLIKKNILAKKVRNEDCQVSTLDYDLLLIQPVYIEANMNDQMLDLLKAINKNKDQKITDINYGDYQQYKDQKAIHFKAEIEDFFEKNDPRWIVISLDEKKVNFCYKNEEKELSLDAIVNQITKDEVWIRNDIEAVEIKEDINSVEIAKCANLLIGTKNIKSHLQTITSFTEKPYILEKTYSLDDVKAAEKIIKDRLEKELAEKREKERIAKLEEELRLKRAEEEKKQRELEAKQKEEELRLAKQRELEEEKKRELQNCIFALNDKCYFKL